MFVALRNVEESKGHVDRFNMDGTGRIHTKLQELAGPVSLHYDYDLNRIFISDAGRGKIESTSVEGRLSKFNIQHTYLKSTGIISNQYIV